GRSVVAAGTIGVTGLSQVLIHQAVALCGLAGARGVLAGAGRLVPRYREPDRVAPRHPAYALPTKCGSAPRGRPIARIHPTCVGRVPPRDVSQVRRTRRTDVRRATCLITGGARLSSIKLVATHHHAPRSKLQDPSSNKLQHDFNLNLGPFWGTWSLDVRTWNLDLGAWNLDLGSCAPVAHWRAPAVPPHADARRFEVEVRSGTLRVQCSSRVSVVRWRFSWRWHRCCVSCSSCREASCTGRTSGSTRRCSTSSICIAGARSTSSRRSSRRRTTSGSRSSARCPRVRSSGSATR